MAKHANDQRYQLRIELKDIKPRIWREVIVPETICLVWLHEVIQEAMLGWMDMHLHQFEHKRKFYSQPDEDDWGESIDESTVALNQLLKKKGDQLTYTYDFGDNWEHRVRVKKILPPDPENILRCVAGERSCPPEDCGGVYGYEELLNLLDAKSKGEKLSAEEKERLEWAELTGGKDEFTEADLNEVNETFEKMLEHALSEGGMGTDGATVYADEIFKAHEFDGEDDNEIEDFIDSLIQTRSEPQMELEGFGGLATSGPEDEDEHYEELDFPEPYEDLSKADRSAFKDTIELANEVRACEPWKRLYDSDIFGIEDPETGDIALVSILGANKEVFALHVHRAPHGFTFWKQAFVDPDEIDENWIYHNNSMIQVEFQNKADLEEPDLALYKLTKAKTPSKGRKKWCQFRNFRPRALPWFPKAEDLALLTRGMRLAMHYLDLMSQSENAESFTQSGRSRASLPETLKTFQLSTGKNPDLTKSWVLRDVPIDWKSCGSQEEPPFQPSEFEVQQLANLGRKDTFWELGAVYFPQPAMTEDGPIIPILALAVDPSEESAPQPYMTTDLEVSATQAVWNCLKERALAAGAIPKEIHVRTAAAESTLQELQKISGIRVVQKEELPLLGTLFQSIASMPPMP